MTQWLEIIIVAFATLIIPFFIWSVNQFKKSIMTQVDFLFAKQYDIFENQIKYNRTQLYKLKERLKHRAEIAYLKYTAIELTIEEIESYLEKTNGYRRRNRISHLNQCNLSQEEDCTENNDDLSIDF